MGRAIQLHQFAFTGGTQTALAMSGRAPLAGRTETGLTQQTAEGLAAEGEALELAKFFAEMVIVETRIGGAGQADHGLAGAERQAAGTGPSAIGVCQSRLSLLSQTLLKTPHLTNAE
jgi:hypothetical protein